MACQGTYEATRIPPNPSCIPICEGCAFSSSVSVQVTDDGCIFTWSVTPSGTCTSSPANGVETLNCPGNKTLTFYCDAGEACPAFKLEFHCSPEPIE